MVSVVTGSNLTLESSLVDGTTGAAINLTGAAVQCKLKPPTGTGITLSASIVTASTGQVSVVVPPSDISTSGTYYYQYVVTISGSTFTSQSQSFVAVAPLF